MKYIIRNLYIPYWKNKCISISLYIRPNVGLCATVWWLRKDRDIIGYEDEWISNRWEHYTLIKRRIK